MNNVIQDYILIEIFYYLENREILNLLMNDGISKEKVESDKNLKLYFHFLEYKNIIILNEKSDYKFEEKFNIDFIRS
jgi:hypothetical protein